MVSFESFRRSVVSALFCAVIPSAGLAMQDALCVVIGWIIVGDLGKGLATLGICAASGAAALGKGSWGMVITVIAGISIMYGCGWFTMQLLQVGSSGCTGYDGRWR